MGLPKTVLIICSLDPFANSVRPIEVKKFLENNGYYVELLNTYKPSDVQLKPKNQTLTAFARSTIRKVLPKEFHAKRKIQYFKQRADLIEPQIRAKNPDVIICESGLDMHVMAKDFPCLKIIDSPTSLIDELYFSGTLTKKSYAQLREMEIEEYEKSDYVAFHWENYTNYVRKHIYNGKNLFTLNWGCTPKEKIASYKKEPSIVFLGLLNGYFVNTPLLSRLSQKHPIDIYGGPAPPAELNLHYLGYASSTDLLADYQFGLVTISDDPLRRQSFSSKQLEYMNYGLPTLTPEWRIDPKLSHVSIYFNEDNFLDKVREFQDKELWQQMSNRCYQQAQEWTWDKNLKPLLEILDKRVG